MWNERENVIDKIHDETTGSISASVNRTLNDLSKPTAGTRLEHVINYNKSERDTSPGPIKLNEKY